MRIAINCCSRDRVTEISLLMQSLRTSECQDWDLFILDDNSGTRMDSFHFFNCLTDRLRMEGHRVVLMRNDLSKGIARARQQLVDYTMEQGDYDFILRLDDDVMVEPDYITKLLEVIDEGYDIASGVTPRINVPFIERETKYVKPYINAIQVKEDKIVFNGDDCGYAYLTNEIIPAHQFRSCALIKTNVHEKVKYPDNLAIHSFREEAFFSVNALKLGFKIGVSTGAVVLHFQTPSGGERSHASVKEDQLNNERMLNSLILENKHYFQESVVSVGKNTSLILTEETQ